MQFAPVGSIHVSTQLERKKLLGNYRLLLAHDVLAHPATYSRAYQRFWRGLEEEKSGVKRNPDDLIIMDNSVVELGSAVTSSQIMAAVEHSYADVVVLADKMLDHYATVAMSLAMQKGIKLHGKPEHLGFMGVVQGRTVDECMRCADALSNIEDVRILGIPKVLTSDQALGTRVVVTARVCKEIGLPVHLLGFSWNPEDDLEASTQSGVVGIDSSLPLRMASERLALARELTNKIHRNNNDFLQDSAITEIHIRNLLIVREFFGCQTDVLSARTEAALSEYGEMILPSWSL